MTLDDVGTTTAFFSHSHHSQPICDTCPSSPRRFGGPVDFIPLDRASILEQALEVSLLRLQVGVATDVLLRNEDIGHGGLARQIAQSRLDGRAIIYEMCISGVSPKRR